MEIITVEKRQLMDLLIESQKPLLEEVKKLKAQILLLKPANHKMNCSKAAAFVGIKRGHLVSISYIDGEEKPTHKKKYKCHRLGNLVMYDIEILEQIRMDLENESVTI